MEEGEAEQMMLESGEEELLEESEDGDQQGEKVSESDIEAQESEEEEDGKHPAGQIMFGTSTFKQLQVSSWLVQNLEAVGISKPTLI